MESNSIDKVNRTNTTTATSTPRSTMRFIMIDTPESNDVLCGKDKTFNRNIGNMLYRQLIISTAPRYITMKSKPEKMNITAQIVHTMIHTHHSRFLKQVIVQNKNSHDTSDDQSDDVTSYYWQEISITAARDKTSHALRFCAAQMQLHNQMQQSNHRRNNQQQQTNSRHHNTPTTMIQRTSGYDYYNDDLDNDDFVYPDDIGSSTTTTATTSVVTPTIVRRSRRGRIQRTAARYSPTTTSLPKPCHSKQSQQQAATMKPAYNPIRHHRHRRTVSRDNVVGTNLVDAVETPIPTEVGSANIPNASVANHTNVSRHYQDEPRYHDHDAVDQNHYNYHYNGSYYPHSYYPQIHAHSSYPPYQHYYNNYHHHAQPYDAARYNDYGDEDNECMSETILPMECPSSIDTIQVTTPTIIFRQSKVAKDGNIHSHNKDDDVGDVNTQTDDDEEDDLDAILREPIEWEEDAVLDNDDNDDEAIQNQGEVDCDELRGTM